MIYKAATIALQEHYITLTGVINVVEQPVIICLNPVGKKKKKLLNTEIIAMRIKEQFN